MQVEGGRAGEVAENEYNNLTQGRVHNENLV